MLVDGTKWNTNGDVVTRAIFLLSPAKTSSDLKISRLSLLTEDEKGH